MKIKHPKNFPLYVPILQCTGSHLVAVGSEDCTVSLVRLCPGSEDTTRCIKVVGTLQGHISSVRALSCSPSGRNDGNRLLFSGGARASLKAWNVGPGRKRHLYINVLLLVILVYYILLHV